MKIINKKDGSDACKQTYEYILGVKGSVLKNKTIFSEIFLFPAKYLQMVTTYLLYNEETERLQLEFENFNKEYFTLRRKFNEMMNKPEDTDGNGDDA